MQFWKLAAAIAVASPVAAAAQTGAPHEAQARSIYEKIVSFRTAKGHGQVPAMAAYLAEQFRAGGVPAEDIITIPHGETVAMLVRIPGRDQRAKPAPQPILFSGHMDVVDARPEDWERDPFKLIEENGYFFGRGTGDNKAGIAAMASTILRLKASGKQPRYTLVFAFIGDEETTMDTTRLVAKHDWVMNARYAINTDAGGGDLSEEGKPVMYGVQGAEKTFASYKLTVRNPGGHSSRPRSDNAIYELSEALLRIRSHRFPVMSNAVTRNFFAELGKVLPGETGEAARRFGADPADEGAAEVIRRDPGMGAVLGTTCVTTMLEAGHAENALPQRASAIVNCRIFPGVTVDSVKATLAEVVGNPKLEIETQGSPEASPISDPRPDVMAAIARSVRKRYPGIPVVPYQESGGTDGKVYRAAGIPTWASSGIFMKDSDMFFHGLNERVPVKAFYEGLEHIHELAVELGGVK
ncbi:MAG TPA: M20/M25/M40 family metallo-hydrolase [Allosphingosinicella sp.]|jgi:acetylornithine deacetylase/succinyl-diaminopimelate desuccinylase-like protein